MMDFDLQNGQHQVSNRSLGFHMT